jgi:hypothetical protein
VVTVEVLKPAPEVGMTDRPFEVVARLNVDGKRYEVEGDSSLFDFDMPVVGITKRRPVAFKRDPEEWARSLPGSYRSPYLLAKVVHDDAGPTGSPYWTREDARADTGLWGSIVEDVVSGISSVLLRARRRGATSAPPREKREPTHIG